MSAVREDRAVLEALGLTRVFVGRRGVIGVSLAITRGEKIALVGPNGAGKTTLLRLLAGILRPAAGEIRRSGGIVVRFLPAREPYYDDLSLRANLELISETTESRNPAPSPLAESRAGHLSSGERRQALLAWGLEEGADLLLLDEPSAHLDAAAREALSRRLAGHSSAVLVATHDDELLPNARRIRLEAGSIMPA